MNLTIWIAIIFFLLGYAIGKIPFVNQWFKLNEQWTEVKKENKQLKKEITILKDYLSESGRGRIIEKK